MGNSIINEIAGLRYFILVSAIGTLLVGIALNIACRQFNWNRRTRKLFGFFYQQSGWDTMGMAIAFLKVFLFLSILFERGQVYYSHMVVFVLLQVGYMIHRRSAKELPYHIIMPVVALGILFVLHILSSYLRDIIFDWRIFVVVILLGILLLLYALLDVAMCYRLIVTRGIARCEKQQKDETDGE